MHLFRHVFDTLHRCHCSMVKTQPAIGVRATVSIAAYAPGLNGVMGVPGASPAHCGCI